MSSGIIISWDIPPDMVNTLCRFKILLLKRVITEITLCTSKKHEFLQPSVIENFLCVISIKLNRSDQMQAIIWSRTKIYSVKCKIGRHLDNVFFFQTALGKNSLIKMNRNKMSFVRTAILKTQRTTRTKPPTPGFNSRLKSIVDNYNPVVVSQVQNS